MQIYRLEKSKPEDRAAQKLIDELSQCLARLTGDSGRQNAKPASLEGTGCVFVLAYNAAGQAVACGGLRPLPEQGVASAEIKRMYAQASSPGAGTAVLLYLEQQARTLGYQELCLETRKVNHKALRFYEKHGYTAISNYGVYRDNPQAACLAKPLRD